MYATSAGLCDRERVFRMRWDGMGYGCVEEEGKTFYESGYDKGVGFVT